MLDRKSACHLLSWEQDSNRSKRVLCGACLQGAVAASQQAHNESTAEASHRILALEAAAAASEERLTRQMMTREAELLHQIGGSSKVESCYIASCLFLAVIRYSCMAIVTQERGTTLI